MRLELLHGLTEALRSDAEGALNKADFVPDPFLILPECRLALLERPHHLEALEGGVGSPQRLEAQSRLDQALQLAVVGPNDGVEVLDLAVLRVLAGDPPSSGR